MPYEHLENVGSFIIEEFFLMNNIVFIFPCSSSVSNENFGAKAVSWDIQVINVKSNLFNIFST